jgi:hypothetical protein
VAAAGFGHKAHARSGAGGPGPRYGAFHAASLFTVYTVAL